MRARPPRLDRPGRRVECPRARTTPRPESGGGAGKGDAWTTIAKAHLWLLNLFKAGSGLIIFAVFVVIVADVGLTILAGWGLP